MLSCTYGRGIIVSLRAPLTVTQVNELVRMTIDNTRIFSEMSVSGEISNLKVHFSSGHMYFTLKDAESVLKCVMFRPSAVKLRYTPENGMKVVAKGRVTVFMRDGQYQLYVDDMEPEGVGSRFLAFEQLKSKLHEEGLFDESKKKALPVMPKRIGVITSASGAAFQDIINVMKRRYPLAEILLYPAVVQGDAASESLTRGILWFTVHQEMADVIIIGRGGGSFEDLNGFNSEKLARAIAGCPIPIVSAVGHETDFTICDFVSDKRAPTPSAAAELVTPNVELLSDAVASYMSRMDKAILGNLQKLSETVRFYSENRMLASPMEAVFDKEKRLKQQEDMLNHVGGRVWDQKKGLLSEITTKLQALSPLAVLNRGYAAVFNDENQVVTSVEKVETNSVLSLRFSDGVVRARTIDILKKESDE